MQKQLYALNMLILVLPEVNRNVLLVSMFCLSVIYFRTTDRLCLSLQSHFHYCVRDTLM